MAWDFACSARRLAGALFNTPKKTGISSKSRGGMAGRLNPNSISRRFLCWLMILLTLQVSLPLPVLAATASPALAGGTTAPGTHNHHAFNLDLSSTTASVTAGNLRHFQQSTIVVNGQQQNVTAASMLTPSEAIAVSQVLHSGVQNIVLGASGAATG